VHQIPASKLQETYSSNGRLGKGRLLYSKPVNSKVVAVGAV
jgi:hypothetical protein